MAYADHEIDFDRDQWEMTTEPSDTDRLNAFHEAAKKNLPALLIEDIAASVECIGFDGLEGVKVKYDRLMENSVVQAAAKVLADAIAERMADYAEVAS